MTTNLGFEISGTFISVQKGVKSVAAPTRSAEEALHRFHKDGETESKKEYSVNECSKYLCAMPSIGVFWVAVGCFLFGELESHEKTGATFRHADTFIA